MARKAKNKWEFGDFQTPQNLADTVVDALVDLGICPATVIEPSCGKGAFVFAADRAFPSTKRILGIDINEQYIAELRGHFRGSRSARVELFYGDFFRIDWGQIVNALPEPLLILGNPPWVTSAELGMLSSGNLPEKSNFQARTGLDAITGKSNFDISEWMLLRHFDWLRGRRGVIAVLCKAAVARKVLLHAWKNKLPLSNAKMFMIDAKQHFDASVDACLLVVEMGDEEHEASCSVFAEIGVTNPSNAIGYRDGVLLSNVDLFERWRHLIGKDTAYVWRSGIKHDCSTIMELEADGEIYCNGAGERIGLEDAFVYPMLKSSDIANGEIRYGRKYMLVTQKFTGEDTNSIKARAPVTWKYLESHQETLSRRASAIYRNRPKYSIFGVGDYSFANWKVAISALYKRFSFKLIEPYRGKAVVLDDTTCFVPCWSESEAKFIFALLSSETAQQFLESMIFWADKRPITIEILKRLDLHALSIELGREVEYLRYARRRHDQAAEQTHGQLALGIAQDRQRYSPKRKAVAGSRSSRAKVTRQAS